MCGREGYQASREVLGCVGGHGGPQQEELRD